ncbi:hypothetical protein PV783_14030 [Chitinophaga sp. CC14]|uniref:hypothetical protein n=1 Tax=Chitinophaga sp. CC14 TaxID=3029199 RepID=UPI003B7D510C
MINPQLEWSIFDNIFFLMETGIITTRDRVMKEKMNDLMRNKVHEILLTNFKDESKTNKKQKSIDFQITVPSQSKLQPAQQITLLYAFDYSESLVHRIGLTIKRDYGPPVYIDWTDNKALRKYFPQKETRMEKKIKTAPRSKKPPSGKGPYRGLPP